MPRVRFRKDAEADALDIRDFLMERNPAAAAHYRALFLKAVRLLRRAPPAGRERPELQPRGLRSWSVRP